MSVKKAFILGAGKGTRLSPLTDQLPKPLVPVFHRPMVELILDHCIAHGIESFIINTHHLADAWLQQFPDSQYRGYPIEFRHEPVLLETGGGIRNIRDWIGDEPLLVYNGDIWTDLNLTQLIQSHQKHGGLATLALQSSGPAPVIGFDLENQQVIDIHGKLGKFTSSDQGYQFTGVYVIDPDLISLVGEATPVSIIPAFLQAITKQKLYGVCLDDATWLDIGTPEMYQDLHQNPIAQNRDKHTPRIHPTAQIHPTASVDQHSFIGVNATISANAVIRSSIIWHNTCIVEEARIEHSIVCEPAS